MKFDLWTFSFQIINFIVLLLILKKVLYRPVREIMEKRRELATKTMEEAERIRREAQEVQSENQAEQKRLKEQHGRLLEEMREEVARERQTLLQETDREVQRRRDKERALLEAEKTRQAADIRKLSIDTVALFAANLCREIADEDLHRALHRRLIEGIEQVCNELRSLVEGGEAPLSVEVISAYPLDQDAEQSLQAALEAGTGGQVCLKCCIDRDLLAGLKIKTGDKSYDASLQGQLKTFRTRIEQADV